MQEAISALQIMIIIRALGFLLAMFSHTGSSEQCKGVGEHSSSINFLFASKKGDDLHKVTYAETKFAMLIAKCNLPFTVADEISKMVGDAFPDSAVAKK